MAEFRPLRIVHSEAATSMGGQENRIFKEMVAMREQGHHLEAICQPDAQLTTRLRDAGFTVHAMPMDGWINLVKGAWKIRNILKRSHVDVLNTHSRRDTLVAGLGETRRHAVDCAHTSFVQSRGFLAFLHMDSSPHHDGQSLRSAASD